MTLNSLPRYKEGCREMQSYIQGKNLECGGLGEGGRVRGATLVGA